MVRCLRRVARGAPGLTAVAATSLASLGLAAVYSHWIEPFWLEVRRLTIDLPGLPASLNGLVVAHLSDFHLGPTVDSREAVAQAVEICNRIRPDLVVLTGDYVSQRGGIGALAQVLRRLEPRPAYAVLGNHDYRFGPQHRRALDRVWAEVGVTLLDNAAARYERGEESLWLVGVGDGYTSHAQLERALEGLEPRDRPRLLLTHYPDLTLELCGAEVDLALAGHTHGAQVFLPILAGQALRNSDTVFASGLYEVNGVPLYVSRGLGTSGHRIRLFARPEVALLTLRSAPRRS